MKILFITSQPPSATGSGGELRSFYFLRAMAQFADVHCVFSSPSPDASFSDIESLAVLGVSAISREEFGPGSARLTRGGRLNEIYSLLRREPWSVADYASEQLRTALHSLVDKLEFDVIIARHTTSAYWFLRDKGLAAYLPRLIVDVDDVKVGREISQSPRVRLDRWMEFLFHRRLAKAGAVTTASDDDKVYIERLAISDHCVVVPNIYIPPDEHFSRHGVNELNLSEKYILFCGQMSYGPNEEGLRYFINDIWPILSGMDPDLQCLVIGRGGSEALAAAAREAGLDYRGEVASTAPYYSAARAAIVPLLSGFGTRIKILESLYCGTPVVSTSKGAEGLAVSNDRDILLADTAGEFSAAVIKILQMTPDQLTTRIANGRELITRHYSEDAVVNGLREAIHLLDRSPS
ncbi:MAG: glycosyltransferase family 4 protein [bacterium]|nr:glycosyltransferase family 4 protein [bacterium]